MKFLWRYMLLVAALMAASMLVAACGGEEELDLDEYFQRLEDISDDAQTRVERLDEKYAGTREDIEAIRDYVDDAEDIFRQALKDLKGLHPPAEARDAHDEFVAAFAANLAVWEDLGDRLADLESPSELEALLAGLEERREAASEWYGNACLQLQGVADENGIDVDLDCE